MFWITILLIASAGAYYYYFKYRLSNQKKVDLSVYRKDGWFGVKSVSGQDSTDIRPFKVNVPDSDLDDLSRRLDNARYIDHVENTQFTYGFNSNILKQVVKYWRSKYDWRAQEAKLNEYEQFKTQIEGIDIHFVRAKPTKPAKTVLPLLVIHGWPGSVLEYYKSFPLLTEPDQNGLAFEVIAPSIPGYGFSEAPHQKGFTAYAAGRVFTKLMQRLGHDRFVVHGGDWGNFITRNIATIYPENVIGAHILGNWEIRRVTESNSNKLLLAKVLLAQYLPSLVFPAKTVQSDYAKLFPLEKSRDFPTKEMGYLQLQATKPDTIGSALVDSPVGLAAYILEKFSTWTNTAYRDRDDGGLTEKFTLDELLTNVMIYWTSGNIASSQRFYKENAGVNRFLGQITVPAATVDAPHELVRTPRIFVEPSYTNLVQYTDLPRGGHFTAFEEPKLVSDDIRTFVTKVIN